MSPIKLNLKFFPKFYSSTKYNFGQSLRLKYRGEFRSCRQSFAHEYFRLQILTKLHVLFQIKYHEEFEKMKGTKITVADDPETLRAKKNMEIASQVEFSQKQFHLQQLSYFAQNAKEINLI